MITKELLQDYIEKFNQHTYPTQLYHELVVEGKQTPNKFSLMGAWKAGAIRSAYAYDKRRSTPASYSDAGGNEYVYTTRWKEDAPVGYATWMAINADQELYRQRIPATFTSEQPLIVSELVARPGFGFIWALFILHCYYPEEYPLYDQHVYRAYRYHETNGQVNTATASNSWKEYAKYRAFFLDLKEKHGYQYWLLDRGLWAYGKEIKQNNYTVSKSIIQKFNMPNQFTSAPYEDGSWAKGHTLGEKKKEFEWKINDAATLDIRRQLKNGKMIVSFTANQIDLLVDYVIRSHEDVYLANNVEKLANRTEREGLGDVLFTKTLVQRHL